MEAVRWQTPRFARSQGRRRIARRFSVGSRHGAGCRELRNTAPGRRASPAHADDHVARLRGGRQHRRGGRHGAAPRPRRHAALARHAHRRRRRPCEGRTRRKLQGRRAQVSARDRLPFRREGRSRARRHDAARRRAHAARPPPRRPDRRLLRGREPRDSVAEHNLRIDVYGLLFFVPFLAVVGIASPLWYLHAIWTRGPGRRIGA